MLIFDLLIARTYGEYDASIDVILERPFDYWLNGIFQTFFEEAKALQQQAH